MFWSIESLQVFFWSPRLEKVCMILVGNCNGKKNEEEKYKKKKKKKEFKSK